MIITVILFFSLILLIVGMYFMPQDDEISPDRKRGDFESVVLEGLKDGGLPSDTELTLKVYMKDGTLYNGKDLTVFLVKKESHRHTMLIHAQAHQPFTFSISPADLVKGDYYYFHITNGLSETNTGTISSINTSLLQAR